PDPQWYGEMVEFVGGADLLLHDAMFTDAEYPRYRGWGHSSFRQAVRLADDAGVRRLALFHHAPDRSDTELQATLDTLRAELAARAADLPGVLRHTPEAVAVVATSRAVERAASGCDRIAAVLPSEPEALAATLRMAFRLSAARLGAGRIEQELARTRSELREL